MKKIVSILVFPLCSLLFNCQDSSGQIILIKNTLDTPREFETVEIKKINLTEFNQQSFEKLGVRDLETQAILVSQFIDEDEDGQADILLFQPKLEPNSEKKFELIRLSEAERPKGLEYCFSRFVPERTDDYAWENNKVAFRTFGPTAQKMVEDRVKGGTLSSGIDAWLKRVDYPIINKWYKKAQANPNAYHKDDGEGLDNFHVGISRGVGGVAAKIDSSYYISKNFTKWKTISSGPIRTSFVLEYANWDAGGNLISETKHISLDYGSNLSRFEVEVTGVNTIYAGLTLHNKKGEPTQKEASGWMSYWKPHDGSELGTGIVVPNGNLVSTEVFVSPLKDWSNLYAQIKVINGRAIYYAGFGWKEAKEFTSKELWESYLEAFSKKINNPLIVSFQ